MSKYRRLKEVAIERGKSLEMIIPPMVNRYGQAETARRLGVSQPTISDWLNENGYIGRVVWMKKTTPQEQADIDAAVQRVDAKRIAAGLPTLEQEREGEFS